jgi:hypothetical protein
MQYYDNLNTGYINFINFRKVMQNLKISLEEKYTEFLIYIMKKFDDTSVSLEDLKYGNLIEIIESDSSISENQEMMGNLYINLVKSESNEIAENDDGEVVITIEQFNEKVDKILSKLAEYLLNSRQKVNDCFKKVICMENVNNESYEAIQLKDFIQIIQSIGIKLDTIDIYCIFTKLKYNDDYETIDLAKLKEEMFNYGIFDENLSKDVINREKENLFSKIRRYLKNHNINFDEFIFDILSKIFIIQEAGKMIRIINIEEFVEFLRDKSILKSNENFTDDEKKLIMINKDINLNKLKDLLENNDVEILNVTDREKYNDESLGLGMIEDGEIEGLDI